MIDIGTSSAISAYSGNITPVYSPTKVSPTKEKQNNSDAEKITGPSYPGEINDEAIISDEAKNLLASEKADNQQNFTNDEQKPTQVTKEDAANQDTKNNQKAKGALVANEKLSQEDKQIIADLKARDSEVKTHEQAHRAAAAGINASAPSYDYETGPDGKKYAVGGEVNVSFREGGSAESDVAKAQAMKAAALAPAQPSSQDLAAARNADALIVKFKEQQIQENEEMAKKSDGADTAKNDIMTKTDTSENSNNVKQTSDDAQDTVVAKQINISKTSTDKKLSDVSETQLETPLEDTKKVTTTQIAGSSNSQTNAMPITDLLGIKA